MILNQLDRRQEPFALQAIPVKSIRCLVRGSDQCYTAIKQGLQESPEQHRIGDVTYMKFIETDHAGPFGKSICDPVQGICPVFQGRKLLVDGMHEPVEMDAQLVFKREAGKEGVHEVGFAAPHAAPKIKPFDRVINF